MKNSRLKKIWSYYWPHTKKFWKSGTAVLIGFGLGGIVANTLVPLVYRELIDTVSAVGLVNKEIVFEATVPLLILLGVGVLTYNALFRLGNYMYSYFMSRVAKDLTIETFTKVTGHSYRFFTNEFTGGLVAKAGRYVNSFESLFDRFVFEFWATGLTLIGTFAVLMYLATYVGIIFFVWMIVYVILTVYFMKKKIIYDLDEATASSKVTAQYSDIITNILNLKMFASRSAEKQVFDNTSSSLMEKSLKASYFQNHINLFQAISVATLEVASIVTAIILWRNGTISAGTIVLVQLYVSSISHHVWGLANALTRISKSISNASEMIEVFEEPLEVTDPENPEEVVIKDGAIAFDDVSFGYHDKSTVLKNFSLSIKPGEKVGIVGHSGAGKTTITKLLLRFLDIQKGTIKIDGQDIAKITQDDLRRNIAYVPQDPILFHRSLKENIAYGRTNASDEDIVNAAKKAHAHEFIEQAPEKYETFVGERGIKLSGGERQRVAIARAMIKDAPILVLDEATSALDTVSEGHIQEAFAELMKGRTTIVIAHRLSTIQKMDRIVVMDEDGVAEEGTHDELLKNKGVYYTFWTQQTNGFI